MKAAHSPRTPLTEKSGPKNPVTRFLRKLGPGLITGAADDDPSGIATYSVAGAQHGTALLWTALITWPLMGCVQFMCARIGMVTGRGLAGTLRLKFPKPLIAVATFALFIANTINIGADLSGMADSAEMRCSSGWFRSEGHDGSTPKCVPQASLHRAALCDLDDGPPVPPDGLPENALSSAELRGTTPKHAGYRTHSKPRAQRKNNLSASGILGSNPSRPNPPAQFSAFRRTNHNFLVLHSLTMTPRVSYINVTRTSSPGSEVKIVHT